MLSSVDAVIGYRNPVISSKQAFALTKLAPDDPTKFIFYGGAAGGGKTVLGCYWLMGMCDTFPGTRWFIGRDSIKDTRESVMVTFRKVAKQFGYIDWKANDYEINFLNGSSIVFIDLSYYPIKDPMFERLGSKEYTGGWIEEAGEVHFEAFDTLKSRVGRHMNKEYGIKPKILITANPKKNWIYDVFYKPFLKRTLGADYCFIPALYSDNPFLDRDYIEMLWSLTDKVKIERLRNGNFEYDDNPSMLCTYEGIRAIFGKNKVQRTGKYYLTADIARLGSDQAIILIWDGFVIVDFRTFDISLTTEIEHAIRWYQWKYGIPNSRCIADEDGIGGGIVDSCDIIGFTNNSKAFQFNPNADYDEQLQRYKEHRTTEVFANLKSQCGYKLAQVINDFGLMFGEHIEMDVDLKDRIARDLEQLQSWEVDKERSLRIKPKEKIKEQIRRSPDWMDVLLFRMFFEYYETDHLTPEEVAKLF